MKRSVQLLLMLSGLFLSAVTALGGDVGSLTAKELKAMIDKGEAGLVIIDSRSVHQYEESHIPGAVSLPLSEMEQDPSQPKVSKESTLVFYCSGTT